MSRLLHNSSFSNDVSIHVHACLFCSFKPSYPPNRCNNIGEFPRSIPPFIRELSLSGNECCFSANIHLPDCCCIAPYDPPCLFAPRLFIGSYGTAHSRSVLEHFNITHIISLGLRLKPLYPKHFTYLVVDVEDEAASDMSKHFVPCFEFIEKALTETQTGCVLIHWFASLFLTILALLSSLPFQFCRNVAFRNNLCSVFNAHKRNES